VKNIIIFSLVGIICLWNVGFTQDNIYGDYLLSGYDKTISLDLQGAQLLDVLKLLSQQSGFNFVSTEAVRERKLTLYVVDVPLREAMDIVFAANHLAYDYYPDSNMYVIKEMGKPDLELKARVYRLRFVRVESSRMQKDIEALIEIEDQGGGDEEEGGDDEEDEEGIKAAVESVLTEFGKVTVDPITNSLTVVDVPSRFPLIDEVVRELDVAQAAVMIEVEMLDVSKNTVDQMGVNWPATLAALDMTFAQRGTSFPFTGGKANSSVNTQNITFDGTTTAAPSGITSASWPANTFGPTILTVVGTELALQFLRTQTDTKFLARPKIMTISNETATVKITTDELIGGTVTSQAGSSQQSFETERAETGTSLRVTPQVDPINNEVTLFVEMVVKEAVDSDFTFGSSSFIAGTLKDPEERKATAVVRLQAGQTLFMGGLIKSDTNDVNTKVPILGDIPILGRAFRHKNKQVEERELMVFITPRIIKEGNFLAKNEINMIQREQFGAPHHKTIKLALDAFTR
jgi:type IV pilus assembly protein PilQ